MSLRINHNIAAVNGHRNMVRNDMAISKSLEKLSSGLRINRAADDAAGLIISEQMRAQITGLHQAIDNAETAISMVQTAEGALDEMNTLLNKARELALHAANEGANDSNQLQADQTELDNIVSSITRIANNTQFGTKKLLDGTLATTKINDSAVVQQFTSEGLSAQDYDVQVDNAGVKATMTAATLNAYDATTNSDTVASAIFANVAAADSYNGNASFANATTVAVTGKDGAILASVTVEAGSSLDSALAALNDVDSGITVGLGAAAGDYQLTADDVGEYANGAGLTFTTNGKTYSVGDNMAGGENVRINTDNTDGVRASATTVAGTSQLAVWTAAMSAGISTAATIDTGTFQGEHTMTVTNSAGEVLAQITAKHGETGTAAVARIDDQLEGVTLALAGTGAFTATLATTDATLGDHLNGLTINIDGQAATNALTTTDGVDPDGYSTLDGVSLSVTGDRGATLSGSDTAAGKSVSITLTDTAAETANTYGNAVTVQAGAKFQIGANQNQTASVNIDSMRAADMGQVTINSTLYSLEDLAGQDFLLNGQAQDAIAIIDEAIDDVTNTRGDLGAFQANALETTVSSLRVSVENLTAAESTIRDTDFAAESASFTRNNIMIQASTAMLAQANQLPQNVLQLLG